MNVTNLHRKSSQPCINSPGIPSPKNLSAVGQRDQSASALTTVVARVDLSSLSRGAVLTCSPNAYSRVEVSDVITLESRDGHEMLANLPECA